MAQSSDRDGMVYVEVEGLGLFLTTIERAQEYEESLTRIQLRHLAQMETIRRYRAKAELAAKAVLIVMACAAGYVLYYAVRGGW